MTRTPLIGILVGQCIITASLSAQAQCGKNNLQFTPFQATGHPTVQVRCRCSDRGTSHNDWFLQFRNDGPATVAVEYYLTNASRSEGPTSLDLGPHRVTPFIRARMWGCLYDDQLFTTVADRGSQDLAATPDAPASRDAVPPAPEPSAAEEDAIVNAATADWEAGPSLLAGSTTWQCALLRADVVAPQADSLRLASCAVRGAPTHVHLMLPKTWKNAPDGELLRYLRNGHLVHGDHHEPRP